MKLRVTGTAATLAALTAVALVRPAAAEAPTTPATDVAVAHLRQEIAHTSGAPWLNRDEITAIAAMNYVVGHVSAPAFGYRVDGKLELPLGGTDEEVAERSLSLSAGICGNAASAMVALLRRFNVPVRLVQFYARGGDHVAVEAKLRGSWAYVDATWGTFYRRAGRLLSVRQIVALTPRQRARFERTHETLLWRIVAEGSQHRGARPDCAR